jgi:hypothetical protein
VQTIYLRRAVWYQTAVFILFDNRCMDSLHSCFISSALLIHSILDSVLHPNRLGLFFFG